MSVTAAQAIANYQSNPNLGPQTLIDSAANVAANLDGLETLTSANDIVSITLTDSGTPTLTITATQVTNDGNALAEIATPFTITQSERWRQSNRWRDRRRSGQFVRHHVAWRDV
jgi:hypothetical protein